MCHKGGEDTEKDCFRVVHLAGSQRRKKSCSKLMRDDRIVSDKEEMMI